MTMPFRRGLALLAAGAALWTMPAGAQTAQPYGAQMPHRENPGEALSRHLRALSEQPKSLGALMGAGQAALELGDANAAITFFARAEEINPRDARIKAGYGSAFVKLEQPQGAIKFFNEAVRSGIAESEIAADRGLAYDMIGDSRRAQRDYQLALRARRDDEIERRLALSLAISGDRDEALAAIDGQLRRQERAAWRTRAFILALNGDAAGATSTAASVIPAQAESLRPFFAQLSGLNPSQKAMAVHFGRFPSDGRPVQMAQNFSTAPNPGTTGSASGTTPSTATRRAVQEPPSTQPRRRPGPDTTPPPQQRRVSRAPAADRNEGRTLNRADRVGSRIPTSTTEQEQEPPARQYAANSVDPSETRPPAAAPVSRWATAGPAIGSPTSAPSLPPPPSASTAPAIRDTSEPSPSQGATPSPPVSTAPAVRETVAPSRSPAAMPPPASQPLIGPPSVATTDLIPSSVAIDTPVATAPPSTPVADAAPGFTSIASLVAGLDGDPEAVPAAEPSKPTQPPPERAKPDPVKPTEARKPAETKPAAEIKKPEPKKPEAKKPAAPKEPSRVWVQVAGGANKRDLPAAYAKLRSQAPALFKGKTAWTTPLRATNRLLVGPFKSESEAQTFVNALAKEKLSGFSWTSPAGQEIEKLPAK